MNKKFIRNTVLQRETEGPLKGQPARDDAALILPITAIREAENIRNDVGDLAELAASIKAHGILQPLLIRKGANCLELVAGHRRLEAARIAGLTEVPVRITGVNENEAAVLKLVENIQRQDLTGPEEILAVASLATVFPDQTQLAGAIGKSKSYVSRSLRAAAIIKADRVATSQLSKSALFELADSSDVKSAMRQIADAGKPTVQTIRKGRKPSGAIPGGRSVDRAIRFNERRDGRAFTLKVHFDFDKSNAGDRERLLDHLRSLIKKLESQR